MIVIERPRVTGKTTILLHYMVVNQNSIYVAITERYAERAFERACVLGLSINRDRFVGMTTLDDELRGRRALVVVDDADVIINRYPDLGFNLVARADVITITKGLR